MKKVFILLILIVLSFVGCTKNSIGIIGSADGPTEIYIGSSTSWLEIAIIIAIAVIILAIIILYIKRKKR